MGRHRLAFGEIPGRDAPQIGLIADHGLDEGVLVDGGQQRAPQLHVVERRIQVVHRQDRLPAVRVEHLDQDVRRPTQHRTEVDQRQFDPVGLALLQRRGGGRGIGLHDPLDAIEIHHFAAGEIVRPFLSRHIAVVPLIGRLSARDPLLRQKPERTGTDGFLDLFGGFGHARPVPAS